MLTVKHIDFKNNKQIVFEALRVISEENPDGSKQPLSVTVVEPSGRTENFKSGSIFVMNESGATVSSWLIDSNSNTEEIEKSISKITKGKSSINDERKRHGLH